MISSIFRLSAYLDMDPNEASEEKMSAYVLERTGAILRFRWKGVYVFGVEMVFVGSGDEHVHKQMKFPFTEEVFDSLLEEVKLDVENMSG